MPAKLGGKHTFYGRLSTVLGIKLIWRAMHVVRQYLFASRSSQSNQQGTCRTNLGDGAVLRLSDVFTVSNAMALTPCAGQLQYEKQKREPKIEFI